MANLDNFDSVKVSKISMLKVRVVAGELLHVC